MEFVSCSSFLSGLKKMAASPLYYFFGEEPFLLEEAVKQLAKETLGAVNDFNQVTFYAEDCEVREVIESAYSMPFGCKRRMVLVRRAAEFNAKDLEGFLAYLEDPAPNTLLAFCGGEGIDSRRKFFKSFEKKGVLVKAEKLKGRGIEEWVATFAKRRGHALEHGAAEMIAFLVGDSLHALDQAIERLSLLVGDKQPITKAVAQSSLSDTREGVVWNLTDALAQGERRRALLSLKRLLREKDTSTYLQVIGALAGFYRRLLFIRTAQALGKADQELVKSAGLSPGAIFMNRKFAGGFSVDSLHQAIHAVSRADKLLKSSAVPGELILHDLVMKLPRPLAGQAMNRGA